jgi:hypothetical protein
MSKVVNGGKNIIIINVGVVIDEEFIIRIIK